MKVFQDGKEVKNARVSYFASGEPHVVIVDGVSYDPAAFELKEGTSKKVTKASAKKTKKTGKLSKLFSKNKTNSEVLSTEDLK